MLCALQPKGHMFESSSGHCVVTLGKLVTHNSTVYVEANGKFISFPDVLANKLIQNHHILLVT